MSLKCLCDTFDSKKGAFLLENGVMNHRILHMVFHEKYFEGVGQIDFDRVWLILDCHLNYDEVAHWCTILGHHFTAKKRCGF